MRGDTRNILLPFVIVGIFYAVTLFSFDNLRDKHSITREDTPYSIACAFVFRYMFGNYVTCSGYGIFGSRHVGTDKCARSAFHIVALLHEYQVGKRFKASFLGYSRTRTAFRLVRQINIFEFNRVETVADTFPQLLCKFSLLLNRCNYSLFPLHECCQFLMHILDVADSDLIHRTCRLLAVSRNKRNCSTAFKQFYRVFHFFGSKCKLLGNYSYKHSSHIFAPRR